MRRSSVLSQLFSRAVILRRPKKQPRDVASASASISARTGKAIEATDENPTKNISNNCNQKSNQNKPTQDLAACDQRDTALVPESVPRPFSTSPSSVRPVAAGTRSLFDALFSFSETSIKTKIGREGNAQRFYLSASIAGKTYQNFSGSTAGEVVEKFLAHCVAEEEQNGAAVAVVQQRERSMVYEPHQLIQWNLNGNLSNIRRCDAPPLVDPGVKEDGFWTGLRPHSKFKFSTTDHAQGTTAKLLSSVGCCAEGAGTHFQLAITAATVSYLLATNPSVLPKLVSTPEVGSMLEFMCFGNPSVYPPPGEETGGASGNVSGPGGVAGVSRLAVIEAVTSVAHSFDFYLVERANASEAYETWTRVFGVVCKRSRRAWRSEWLAHVLTLVSAPASSVSPSPPPCPQELLVSDGVMARALGSVVASIANEADPMLNDLVSQMSSQDAQRHAGQPLLFAIPSPVDLVASAELTLAAVAELWHKELNVDVSTVPHLPVVAAVSYSPFSRAHECCLWSKNVAGDDVRLGSAQLGPTPFVAYYNAVRSVLEPTDHQRALSLYDIWLKHKENPGVKDDHIPSLTDLRSVVAKTVGLSLTMTILPQGADVSCAISAYDGGDLSLLLAIGRGKELRSAVANAVALAFLHEATELAAANRCAVASTMISPPPKLQPPSALSEQTSAPNSSLQSATVAQVSPASSAAAAAATTGAGGATGDNILGKSLDVFTFSPEEGRGLLSQYMRIVQTITPSCDTLPQLQLSIAEPGTRRDPTIRITNPKSNEVIASMDMANAHRLKHSLRRTLINMLPEDFHKKARSVEFLHAKDYSAKGGYNPLTYEDALNSICVDFFGAVPLICSYRLTTASPWICIAGIMDASKKCVLQIASSTDAQKRNSRRAVARGALNVLEPQVVQLLDSRTPLVPKTPVDTSLRIFELKKIPAAEPLMAGPSQTQGQPPPSSSSLTNKNPPAQVSLEDVLREAMKQELNCGLRVEVRPLSAGGKSIHAVAVPLLDDGMPDLTEEFEVDQLTTVDMKKGVNLLMYKLLRKNHPSSLKKALTDWPNLIKDIV